MKLKEKFYRRSDKNVDICLLVTVLALVVFGLIMIYSTSAYNGNNKFADKAYYFKKQFFATSIGLAVMYVMIRVPYTFWKRYALAGYAIANILSIAVLFIGVSLNGSKRWIAVGPLSFQPSEFAKLAVIVFLAAIISERKTGKKQLLFLISCFLLTLPICLADVFTALLSQQGIISTDTLSSSSS